MLQYSQLASLVITTWPLQFMTGGHQPIHRGSCSSWYVDVSGEDVFVSDSTNHSTIQQLAFHIQTPALLSYNIPFVPGSTSHHPGTVRRAFRSSSWKGLWLPTRATTRVWRATNTTPWSNATGCRCRVRLAVKK